MPLATALSFTERLCIAHDINRGHPPANGAERATRDSGDSNRHGVLLGATGAIASFFVSSLVNYNFGAGIVALVFWWLMGVVVVLAREEEFPAKTQRR